MFGFSACQIARNGSAPDFKRLCLRRLLAARLLPQSRLSLAVAGRLEGDMGVLWPK